MSSSRQTYLPHLDALRAFAMLFGILVHAGTLADTDFSSVVAYISDRFRMATFFLVSAMLSALVLSKRSSREFIKKRLITLLVPFMVGLALLNIPTWLLVYDWHNPDSPREFQAIVEAAFVPDPSVSGPLVWHLHLWFLLSLSAYAMAIPSTARAIRRLIPWGRAILNRTPRSLHLPGVAILIVAVGLGLRVFYEAWLQVLPDLWLVKVTCFYFPFVVAGLVIMMSPRLLSAFERFSWLILLAGLIALAVDLYYLSAGTDEPAAPVKLLLLVCSYLITFAAVHLLYQIASRFFRTENRIVRYLVGGIFTVYLFHYFLIYSLASVIGMRELVDWKYIVVVAALSVAMGLLVHSLVIKRFALTRFLFNGERQRAT